MDVMLLLHNGFRRRAGGTSACKPTVSCALDKCHDILLAILPVRPDLRLGDMTVKQGATRTRDRKSLERRDQLQRWPASYPHRHAPCLRIAANSEFSHGVVHYYFADKTELITYCVRYYKAQCATRYDAIVASATTAEELRLGFADKLCETLVEDSSMHRLWYDMRTQAMFDPALQPDVLMIDSTLEEMIWRVLSRYAALSGQSLTIDSPTAYALLDRRRRVCGMAAQPRARFTPGVARGLTGTGPHQTCAGPTIQPGPGSSARQTVEPIVTRLPVVRSKRLTSRVFVST